MFKRFHFLLIVLAVLNANAQHPGYRSIGNPAAFKENFSAAYRKIESIQCQFKQEKQLSMISEKLKSTGRFWFKKENLVRMVYEQPFQYLLVMNNNDVWVRDGETDSHISANSSKLFQQLNRLIIDCVRGTALNITDFSSQAYENDESYLVELVPTSKTLKAILKNINIVLDKKDFSVSGIQMFELSGDNTSIRFYAKEFNVNIPDALFAIH